LIASGPHDDAVVYQLSAPSRACQVRFDARVLLDALALVREDGAAQTVAA
jgi:hypothetical protein